MKLEPHRRESVVIDPRAVDNNGVGDDAWCEEEFEEEEEDEEEDAGPDEESEEEDGAEKPQRTQKTRTRQTKKKILPKMKRKKNKKKTNRKKTNQKKTSLRARPGNLSMRRGLPVLSVPNDPRQGPDGNPEPKRTPTSPTSTKARLPVICWRRSTCPDSSEGGYRWRLAQVRREAHAIRECPIQSRTLRLSGIATQPAIPISRRP